MTRRVTHHLYLRDGSVTVGGSPGSYNVKWIPLRDDHPDAPELVVLRDDAEVDATLAWAREFFDRRDSRDLVEVTIESGAGPAEIDALRRLFDGAGMPAVVQANYSHRSADPLPWVMIIKAPLMAFVLAFAGKAGGDAWEALRSAISRIYEVRRRAGRPDGAIILDEGGRRVVLTTDLPDEAGRSLVAGELPTTGYVVWDPEAEVWRC